MTGQARRELAHSWRVDVPMVMGTYRSVRPLTANDRLHWRVKAEKVATIRDVVARMAKSLRIPAQEHITVQLHYRPGDSRDRDAPNLVATSKPAVDGIVDAGIVPTDTARFVTELMPVIHEGRGQRQLWLVIEADGRPDDRLAMEELR